MSSGVATKRVGENIVITHNATVHSNIVLRRTHFLIVLMYTSQMAGSSVSLSIQYERQ